MKKRRVLLGILCSVTIAILIAITGFLYLVELFTSPPTDTSPLPELPRETVSVGGLFMIGHWAYTPVASTTALIAEHQFAGVIIMSAPKDPTEIRDWVAAWNEVSTKPLIIGIDQEGGPVSRLAGTGFTPTGQRDISDKETAYEVGLKRGQELAALGINMNFAPVLDMAKNPDSFMYERVFPDSEGAADLATALAQGMQAAGITPVAKHFPGHDDTNTDSHLTLPSVTITQEELPLFAQAFEQYLTSKPPALMTAHVIFPEIDTYPATLSHFFLTDYLRHELKFTGVIITDDMSMDAIDTTWSTPEATVLSLKAGADLILFAAEPGAAVTALARVKQAQVSGELSIDTLRKNLERIDLLRPIIE